MIRDYIILAVGCATVGVVLAFGVIWVALRFQINIFGDKIWLLGIPAALAIILNIILVEIFRTIRDRRKK
ncbi:MAG: hypothetical protein ABID87_02385 [Chloroflexota bacterium]